MIHKGTKVASAGTGAVEKRSTGYDFRHLGIWFLCYFTALLFWELMMYYQVNDSFHGFSVWIVVFLPALALVPTTLTGWWKNRAVQNVISVLLMAVLSFFYIAQLIYYRIFGSLFSMSMVGIGGQAVGQFGWAMSATLVDSIGWILIFLLPVAVLLAVLLFTKKQLSFRPMLHMVSAVGVALLWLAAVLLLPLSGNDTYSAYSAYHSMLVDTDMASSKIGALTNSVVETATMFLGGDAISDEIVEDNGRTELNAADSVVVTLGEPTQKPEKAPNTETSADSFGEADETTPEEDCGSPYNIIEEIDFNYLATVAEDKATKELCEYLSAQTGTLKNEYTGLFKGYNLIYICAESFSGYLLDERVNPVLTRMSQEGVVLTNFYNSFKNTTTNGEYAFLTSLWPDVSRQSKFGTALGSFAQSADNYMPMGLGYVSQSQLGIPTRAYHNYFGEYYSRVDSWSNLGMQCRFMDNGDGTGMTFTTSWPSSDLEMFEQSVDDYINDDQFFTYYMTFSGHGSYKTTNCIVEKNLDYINGILGRNMDAIARGYFAANYELELAMEYLMDRLEAAGKLDNTVIVLIGDHFPYYLSDDALNTLGGHTVNRDTEMYKSNCIIWCGGLSEPIVTDTLCCNVDILPTILNLFGMKYDSRLMAGTDIFSDGTHLAQLYSKTFITENAIYYAHTGSVKWLIDTSGYQSSQLKAYIDSLVNYTTARYSMSLKIADTDFYRFAWVNSGLVSEDDIVVGEVKSYYYVETNPVDPEGEGEGDEEPGTVPEGGDNNDAGTTDVPVPDKELVTEGESDGNEVTGDTDNTDDSSAGTSDGNASPDTENGKEEQNQDVPAVSTEENP